MFGKMSQIMKSYSELSHKLRELKEKRQYEYAIDVCDAIIALITNNNMNIDLTQWKEEKTTLITRMKEKIDHTNIKKEITKHQSIQNENLENLDWNEYFSLLLEANTLESTDKKKSKELLIQCLNILKQNESNFKQNFPSRLTEKEVLESRLYNMAK